MPVKIEDGRIELKIDLGGTDCGDVTWIEFTHHTTLSFSIDEFPLV
jgi:hypothetical protein